MKTINFTGWNPEFNKVGMTQLLRDEAGMSFIEAKKATDAILAKQSVSISLKTVETAQYVFDEAVILGATGTLDE